MNEIRLNCKVEKKCNSCQLNNLDYKSQLRFKESKVKKLLSKFGEVNKIIYMDEPFAYRNKAQVVYKIDKDKKYIPGIYKSTTKSIVPISNCKLHTKRQNEIIMVLSSLLKSFKIKPYDFHKLTGWLKSVVIREGFKTGEILVVLVGKDDIFPAKDTFISALIKKCPYITSVVTTVNTLDMLFTGYTSKILYGDGYIKDNILGKTFYISPNSFFQVNPIQTEKLYKTAIELADINNTDIVLDAYCGVGTIGIIASDKAKKVYGIEVNKDAIFDANRNKELNLAKNIEFICGDVKEYINNLNDIDIALIDPPRAGCDNEFINSLSQLSPKKIVYISCNIETQEKDLTKFIHKGYSVKKIQPVDMFPQTNHIETVCLMSRKEK